MSDLISRQAAIDAVIEWYGCEPSDIGAFEDIIEKMPSAQPEPRWIPCDKGEPEEDMECWVTVKTTDVLYRGNFTKRYAVGVAGERRDKGFITSGGFMWWNTALAWMPIYEPEPYRTEVDGFEEEQHMKCRESKPFSSGTEYEVFMYNWCENCNHYKLRDSIFPENPENGGCPVLYAMENAFVWLNIDEFPKKDIVEKVDDAGNVVSRHYCTRFERRLIDERFNQQTGGD